MPLFPGDGFNVPTRIKITLNSNNYVLIVDENGTLCKISKVDLVASLASGDTGGDTGGVARTYATTGDNNGVFYYIGTSEGATNWVNPTTHGLVVTASSILGSATTPATTDELTNRVNSDFATYNFPNNWVSFYLGAGKSLICDYYTINARATQNDMYPRNWVFQGSNDGNNWIDLDTQSNNSTIGTSVKSVAIPLTSSIAYEYFRLYTTGNNSSNYYLLALGEMELYGSFVT